MDEFEPTHVFTVRNRPVGFRPSRWGGSLVAVERGDFPISPTGYRSLAGFGGGSRIDAADISSSLLLRFADEHQRSRNDLLRRLRKASHPVDDPIMNYIHASSAYEPALLYGFFASDSMRHEFWNGAHQLLSRVLSDSRFQPTPQPNFPQWTAQHCAAARAKVNVLHTLLRNLSAGKVPTQLSSHLFGVSSYLGLPPKPNGEPKLELTGHIAELALHDPVGTPATKQRRTPTASTMSSSPTTEAQLGLFAPASTAHVKHTAGG